MEREIITADGDRETITAHRITEFGGDVYAFPEQATLASVLTGDTDYEKFEGAHLA